VAGINKPGSRDGFPAVDFQNGWVHCLRLKNVSRLIPENKVVDRDIDVEVTEGCRQFHHLNISSQYPL
jgi:hypothetical protein